MYWFDSRQITDKIYKCDKEICITHIEIVYRERWISQLIQQFKDKFEISIGFHQEETDVEKVVRQLAHDNNIWTSTLYHPDDLPYNNPKAFPDVFTQFRVTLDKKSIRVRCLINISNTFKPLSDDCVITSIPSLTDFGYSSTIDYLLLLIVIVHPNSVFSFKGGESFGLAHLQEYVWEKNLVLSYKQTRNSLTDSENSTKFSPWLSNGSLSSRKIFFELKRYESEQGIPDAGY
ncbi:unnamed protein product [Rotaria sp. Silwood1]|nr:unnamed protein product [Rotaria sp. Silwood1]CAF1591188.1 unnamed protein product [Rotaria sp. Silwood1]CAF3727505.1 unnamed protein product [Rotaria sp. Silwood1]CAF4663060.1 unnamed protein product [Rotaria sp. Silwood1]